MALKFGASKGSAQKDRADSYSYKDGENRIRLVGDVLPRYVYWIKGENNKNLPFECLAFDRDKESFTNVEKDYVKEYYPDMKCGWAYAMQCIDLQTGEVRLLNLKKKLFAQILDLAEQLEADPTDPDEGFDIVFEKKKTGPLPINVEYSVKQLKCKKRPLSDEERQKIADLKSMDEVLPRNTPEQQKELLEKLQKGASENVDEEISEELGAE